EGILSSTTHETVAPSLRAAESTNGAGSPSSAEPHSAARQPVLQTTSDHHEDESMIAAVHAAIHSSIVGQGKAVEISIEAARPRLEVVALQPEAARPHAETARTQPGNEITVDKVAPHVSELSAAILIERAGKDTNAAANSLEHSAMVGEQRLPENGRRVEHKEGNEQKIDHSAAAHASRLTNIPAAATSQTTNAAAGPSVPAQHDPNFMDPKYKIDAQALLQRLKQSIASEFPLSAADESEEEEHEPLRTQEGRRPQDLMRGAGERKFHIVAVGDQLVELAERLFGDGRVAYLMVE